MKKALLCLFVLVSFAAQAQNEKSTSMKDQVVHHVFFYLKNPESAADKAALKEGLKTLEAIPEVKQLFIGEPASTLKRDVVVNDWHVSEIMYFENVEDQDAYQSHPVHMKFVENCQRLWDKVIVYDTRLD